MKKNIVIIGGNIIGLYSAIKLVELGYDVCIIDKKETLGNVKYNNYSIFNKTHTLYINLLNKFSINYSSFSIRQNERLFNLLTYIIAKSRLIPKKNIISQSFSKFCRSILNAYEYEILQNSLSDYEYIYANMNAMDCITMFSYDITSKQEYYKLDDDITVLIKRMVEYLAENGVKIIRGSEVKEIKYDNNIYLINGTLQAHIIVLTLSKKNLMHLRIWTKEQRSLLNHVSTYNIDMKCLYNTIKEETDENSSLAEHNSIRNEILEKMHISYPIMKSIQTAVDLWNIGTNSIIIREKIKNISPALFICNMSHSKNALFIHHGLETFDCILSKIIRICSVF
jgi:hypothetical protein